MFKRAFNLSSTPKTEAEEALDGWGIKYKKQADGTLLVSGDLNISSKSLNKLPDLTSVIVTGDFNCGHNNLKTLKGSPQSVGGTYRCNDNKLITLEGAPPTVGKDFWCIHNDFTTLKGAPQKIGGDFLCYESSLVSLEGGPQDVGGDYRCNNNNIASLKGAAKNVGGSFACHGNPLALLQYAPEKFTVLRSDLGEYFLWSRVPEKLKMPADELAELMANRARAAIEEIAAAAVDATTLQKPMSVQKPLRFKRESGAAPVA